MDISYYEKIALSNTDLIKMLDGKAKVVLYPDIHKYTHIDELLYPYESCFLLYETHPNYGHWCALLKTTPTDIEFFNSYGGIPDETLRKIDKKFRIETDQNYPYLTQLLCQNQYNVSYNEFRFQKLDADIRTCGRWAITRILTKHLTIYQYKDLIDKLCIQWKATPDEVVTLLTIN